MNVSINKFIVFLKEVIKNASPKYKFYKHINNREKLREVYFPNTKNLPNIRNIIEAHDFLYFMCRKSLNNDSYGKVSGCMRDEEILELTTDAYKKQSQRKPYTFFEYVYGQLSSYYNENCLPTCTSTIKGKLSAVDGSHYTLSKLLTKDNLPSYNNGNTTSLTVLMILNQENRIPIYVNSNKNNNEIEAFVQKLSDMNKNYIFVCDRLFYSEKLFRQIKTEGHDAIFRLQCKESYIKEFMNSKKTDTIITINGKKKVKRGSQDGVRIRLVKYFINNNLFILGTTLLDKKKYPITFLMDAYKHRWEIEEFYKLINYELHLKDSNVKTFNGFQQELYIKLIIVCLAKIFSFIAIKYCAVPLKKNEHINFKCCMNTVTVHILREILYGSSDQLVSDKIKRLVQNIRLSTVISEDNRSFIRKAVRTNKKWYYLFYNRKKDGQVQQKLDNQNQQKLDKKNVNSNKSKKNVCKNTNNQKKKQNQNIIKEKNYPIQITKENKIIQKTLDTGIG